MPDKDKGLKTKAVAVRFDESTFKKVEEVARTNGHKVSTFIRFLVEKHIEEQEKQNG